MLKVGAAIVAAVTAAGGAGTLLQAHGVAHTIPPAAGRIAARAPAPHRPQAPARRTTPLVTVQVATRPRLTRRPRRPPPHALPAPPAGRHHDAPRGPAHHGGCDLGTLGICGL
jgi:hypothetical protein